MGLRIRPHGILAHLIRTHANVYTLENFTSLLDFAHELHHELLRDATVIAWLQQIVSGRFSSEEAMHVGERLGDRGFLTALYEHVLREQLSLFSNEQNVRGPAAAFNPSNRVDLGLPPIHTQRILSAYSTLTRAWSQLRQTPPPVLQHPQCAAASAPVPAERHTTACLNAHVNLWRVTFASVDAMPIPWTANGMRQRLECVRNILLKGQVPSDAFGGYCRYVPSLARDDFLMRCFASVPLTTRRYLFGKQDNLLGDGRKDTHGDFCSG
uniref:Uncharacterized protein n=1 Tax=Mycena chlorophos TaxID=658473 RepID=A0ABQ0M1B8_MYCCL|nr:predicted protein [Mycena chlorophos]